MPVQLVQMVQQYSGTHRDFRKSQWKDVNFVFLRDMCACVRACVCVWGGWRCVCVRVCVCVYVFEMIIFFVLEEKKTPGRVNSFSMNPLSLPAVFAASPCLPLPPLSLSAI
jgi:hypothetical protein